MSLHKLRLYEIAANAGIPRGVMEYRDRQYSILNEEWLFSTFNKYFASVKPEGADDAFDCEDFSEFWSIEIRRAHRQSSKEEAGAAAGIFRFFPDGYEPLASVRTEWNGQHVIGAAFVGKPGFEKVVFCEAQIPKQVQLNETHLFNCYVHRM